jgi:CRISPR type III-B/RAMP module RAMP protein Cmr6
VDAYHGAPHPTLVQGRLYGAHITAKEKAAQLDGQAGNLQRYEQNHRALLQTLLDRQDALADPAAGRFVATRTLQVAANLVVGLGLPNPVENGFLLHPLYGVPYLPANAIKGVTQSFLLHAYAAQAGIPELDPLRLAQWNAAQPALGPTPFVRFERLLLSNPSKSREWDPALQGLERALDKARQPSLGFWSQAQQGRFADWQASDAQPQAEAYRLCFGAPNLRGQIWYLDALPEPGSLQVGVDVLTPHAQLYYTQAARAWEKNAPKVTAAPGDYYNPVPVPFLVIQPGTRFRLTVLAENADDPIVATTHAQQALDLVAQALRETGIGAKTSSGYGRLNQPRR